MPSFCASCTDERADLEMVDFDGRLVAMCGPCRKGEVRGGNWSFGAPSVDRRANAHGNRWKPGR